MLGQFLFYDKFTKCCYHNFPLLGKWCGLLDIALTGSRLNYTQPQTNKHFDSPAIVCKLC